MPKPVVAVVFAVIGVALVGLVASKALAAGPPGVKASALPPPPPPPSPFQLCVAAAAGIPGANAACASLAALGVLGSAAFRAATTDAERRRIIEAALAGNASGALTGVVNATAGKATTNLIRSPVRKIFGFSL